ncbi:glycine oxidase [Neisseria sp. HSC-16F19]|nr:FAD-dependent oxidoreductase [Neisseria sp. HSC-16F19]MCP2041481.1 glycine oxidase [Neisseria sp. HSC-16F19]
MNTQRRAVVGGGLLGRLLAWRWMRQGHEVVLYAASDRAGHGSAAHIAAAMLAPQAEAVDATPLAVRLGYASLPLWAEWLVQLSPPVWWQQQGTLVVWHGQDRALAQQFVQHLHRAGAGAWQEWDAAALAVAEPQLAGRFARALYLPDEGQIDGRALLNALADALEAGGVQCHWQQPAGVAALAGQFDWVADCRGMGAKADWNRASGSRLRGVRGEVLRVHAPEVRLQRPVRLLHPRYPLYVVPKPQQQFVVGATQLESEADDAVSVRGSLELLSALYAVHPAFGEARLLESAAGVRPTLNHDNPEIRCCPKRRLLAVNGLFRHGFMIAPAVVEAVLRVTAQAETGALPETDTESGIAVCGLGAG